MYANFAGWEGGRERERERERKVMGRREGEGVNGPWRFLLDEQRR